MLKKILFLALLLSSSASCIAKEGDSVLTIAPYHPSEWGYIAAKVAINQHPSVFIGNGITLHLLPTDKISLTEVVAMNVHPKIDDTCLHIEPHKESKQSLIFQLKPDWLIHCHLSNSN